MDQPIDILRKYWGYESFRPLQEEIVRAVLDGRDTLALLPTGGGKSITFQVPGIALGGLCLVVSPLVALMKDQVAGLRKRGIPAAAIYSGMHARETDLVLTNAGSGKLQFLYVSPERLLLKDFRERLKHFPLSLIAVDEAHCISQWGFDFRPAYLRIAEIREEGSAVPMIAVTATATEQVVSDIAERLEMRDPAQFRQSFARENLVYGVRKTEAKAASLLSMMRRTKGSSVVYVRNRRKTREVAEYLDKQGVSARYYHAGVAFADKEKRQSEWMGNRFRCMVSTNAFGMGIDKPDVRSVVHLDVPDSPEAYYQEAGRAGRDGASSYAVIFYSPADEIALQTRLEADFPEAEEVAGLYQQIGSFLDLAYGSGEMASFGFELGPFLQQYDWKPARFLRAMRLLEQMGYLGLSDPDDHYGRIRLAAGSADLYRFQVENPSSETLLQLLLRGYAGIAEDFVRIKEAEIASRIGVPTAQLIEKLQQLDQLGIAQYLPPRKGSILTYYQARLRPEQLHLDSELIDRRKEQFEMRINAMLEYIRAESGCRNRLLLRYFGEDSKACGSCDLCRESAERQTEETTDELINGIIERLKAQPTDSRTLSEIFPNISSEALLAVLADLLEEGHIRVNEQQQYEWTGPES